MSGTLEETTAFFLWSSGQPSEVGGRVLDKCEGVG